MSPLPQRLHISPLLSCLALALALGLPATLVTSGQAAAQQQSAKERLLEIQRQRQQGQAPGGQAPGAGGTPGAPAPAGASEAATIETEGLGTLYKNDPARSREEALEAAQRAAVEQASGVFLTSETTLRNFELVSDEVLSNTQGYIQSYDVIREGTHKNRFYRVVIRAVVMKQAFMDSVNESLANLYRRVGMPRVMLVVEDIRSTGDGELEGGPKKQTALNVVEKEIRKILLKQGFTFIDARAVTQGSLLEKAQKGRASEREGLLDAARTTKAEILMIGSGRLGQPNRMQRFNIVEASVGLDVVRTDNGQVMASEVISDKGIHINPEMAVINALKRSAQKLTPRIMEQVTSLWIKEKNQGRRLEMLVVNIAFKDVKALRQSLGNQVKGVKKVRMKSYSKGAALFEIESRDSPARLAESLMETSFKNFTLEPEEITDTTLTVKVTKP